MSIVTLSRVALVGLIAASGLLAQQELPYRITTVAGSGAFRFRDNGQQAAQARLVDPQGVARDDAGNVYFSDGFFNIVLRVSPAGTISRLAGTGDQGLAGDEGPALDALFNQPRGVALDASENLYVVDRLNGRIRRIDSSGVITTIAGGRSGNDPGNGGSAIKAVLFEPQDIVIDREKNILYFSEPGRHQVRRIDLSNGTITVAAGNSEQGDTGEGALAIDARLNTPTGLGLDRNAALLIADSLNFKVKRVAPDGTISTIAGDGRSASLGDGGLAAFAEFDSPQGLAVTPEGTLLVADTQNHRVREIGLDRVIQPFAGTGSPGFSGDGGAALEAELELPFDVAIDRVGNTYISTSAQIIKVTPDGVYHRIAGVNRLGFSGDGGPARDAELSNPFGLAVDDEGVVYFADRLNLRVRRLEPVNFLRRASSTQQVS